MSYDAALDVLPSAEVALRLQGVHTSDRRRMIEQATAVHVGFNASTKDLHGILEDWSKPVLPAELAREAEQINKVDPDEFFKEGLRYIGGL